MYLVLVDGWCWCFEVVVVLLPGCTLRCADGRSADCPTGALRTVNGRSADCPSSPPRPHQCRLGAMTNSSSWPPPRSSLSPPLTAREAKSRRVRPFKKLRQTLEPTTVASGKRSRTFGGCCFFVVVWVALLSRWGGGDLVCVLCGSECGACACAARASLTPRPFSLPLRPPGRRRNKPGAAPSTPPSASPPARGTSGRARCATRR